MITDAFIKLVVGIPNLFFSSLPASQGFSFDVVDRVKNLIESTYGLNWLFPISELLILVSFILSFELALLGVRFGLFIINYIRGK